MRAVVKAEIHPYFYENVVATIPGTDPAALEDYVRLLAKAGVLVPVE